MRLVTRDEIAELLERSRGRTGVTALRDALAHRETPSLTRSAAEERMLALVRSARLPHPVTNARLGPYEVDFLWPDRKLVVEVDGFAFHSTRAAFERDRGRDAELQALGYRVMRITWHRLVEESGVVIARLAAALAFRVAA